MSKFEITPVQEKLARFAKAMGHPTRIAILHFLSQRDECFFGDIHEVLPIAKATVSQHLSELKEAGLIQGTIEPPKVRYCIDPENWAVAMFAGIVPIVQVFVAKGIPIGTALAFMMAVIGLSLPEAMLLKKVMTWRLIGIFFGVVTAIIIFSGYLFNWLI